MSNPELHAALLAYLTVHSGDHRPEPERFADQVLFLAGGEQIECDPEPEA